MHVCVYLFSVSLSLSLPPSLPHLAIGHGLPSTQLAIALAIVAWGNMQAAHWKHRRAVPWAAPMLLRLQGCVVLLAATYFLALSGDWLTRAQPLRLLMHDRTEDVLGAAVDSAALWFGLAYAVAAAHAVVPLMLWLEHPLAAHAAVVLQGVLAAALPDTGLLPYVMAALALGWLAKPVAELGEAELEDVAVEHEALAASKAGRAIYAVAVAAAAVIIFMPLRHNFYAQTDLGWATDGAEFAWYPVFASHHDTWVRLTVVDKDTGSHYKRYPMPTKAQPVAVLTKEQVDRVQSSPVALHRWVEYEWEHRPSNLTKGGHVVVDAFRSLNGGPYARWLHGNVDLVSLSPQLRGSVFLLGKIKGYNSAFMRSLVEEAKFTWETERNFLTQFYIDRPDQVLSTDMHEDFDEAYMLLIDGDVSLSTSDSPVQHRPKVMEKEALKTGATHVVTTHTPSFWMYAFK